MGAKDTPRCVNIAEAAHFSPDMRVNEEVMATPTLVTRMNCYEPGQVTPMHLHPGEDEIIYVVEGNGHFAFQDRENLPFRAGDLVCLPGDQFHSIVAGPDGRAVVIYFMSPNYASVRPAKIETTQAGTPLPGERV
jgi:quercetin dioxygenase-like cupin family protein